MYHTGHQIMHHYLVHTGMHPADAHHVVINSGSGVVDWFKMNKDSILEIIKNIGSASLPYVKNAIKNAAKQHIDSPLIRSGVDYLTDYGTTKLGDYLKKPRKNKKMEGSGFIDFIKRNKDDLISIGKAGHKLYTDKPDLPVWQTKNGKKNGKKK